MPFPNEYRPCQIFVEKTEKNSAIFNQAKSSSPKAKIIVINDFSDFLKENPGLAFDRDNLFIVRKYGEAVKPCPCASQHRSCGYYVLNLGYGCPFECSYCYFQYYGNSPGLVLHSNVEEVLLQAKKIIRGIKIHSLRIGTGEFSDSLALDHLSGYSKILVPFFSEFKNIFFELKTKSINIEGLEGLEHRQRTVISWSVNPQGLINSEERGTATLKERLEAARRCAEWGYRIGFHFDPVILTRDWEAEYSRVIDAIFDTISAKDITWISLGMLRFEPKLKSCIGRSFPDSKIIYDEFLAGLDNKLRYFQLLRRAGYRSLVNRIRARSKQVFLYLCMETDLCWRDVFG